MPFSQDAYRKANKLKIIGSVPNKEPYSNYYKDLGISLGEQDIIFEAYTAQGYSLQAATNQQGTPFGLNSGLASRTLFSAFGKAPVLDYPRRFLYAGTQPFNWKVDCYLNLDDPYAKSQSDPASIVNQNINYPIRRLLGLFLPSRSEEAVTGTIVNAINSWNSGWLGSGAAAAAEQIDQFAGKIFSLNVPFPYDVSESNASTSLVFKMGTFRIEDIVVKNINIRVPPYTYENGLPDHVDLSIEFETLRPLTTETFSGNLFDITRGVL